MSPLSTLLGIVSTAGIALALVPVCDLVARTSSLWLERSERGRQAWEAEHQEIPAPPMVQGGGAR